MSLMRGHSILNCYAYVYLSHFLKIIYIIVSVYLNKIFASF